MKTGIITTDTYLQHDTGQGHPKKADRVTVIIDRLKKIKSKNLIWKKPKKFDLRYLEYAHDKNYLDNVKDSFPKQGLNFLDGDTIVSPGSKDATRDAVGSILTAIDGVMKKDFNNAFCAVRPPGHHAEKQKAMGFCVYNNIAVGAYYLLEKYKLKKVAIIDFDVHHGNGTQNIFSGDKDFLYASTHQFPFYPGTGSLNENVDKHIVNAPLKAYSGSLEFREAMEKHIFPNINKFNPELILISAGFDAHKDDPLGQLNLDEKDFIWVTNEIKLIAEKLCDNRLVSILEGGYNISALSSCVLEHIKVLAK